MTEKKPERTLELHVDIDAPLEAAWKAITEGPGIANWFAPVAEVTAPGEGATVKAGWSEEMVMTSAVVAWEPLQHVRWLDESGWMGPGTSMAVDYYLSTENGKTRVRLVQPDGDIIDEKVLLQRGQSRTWRVDPDVILRVGNAKAANVTVDGISQGVMGKQAVPAEWRIIQGQKPKKLG
jgi:uncharacterized protein YndB with AHSA1/START domain